MYDCPIKKKKRNGKMIAITKEEKEKIIERFPNIYIVRTMKQKSKRHHYFCEESKPVLKFLNRIRGDRPLYDNSNNYRKHRHYKKSYQRNTKTAIAR